MKAGRCAIDPAGPIHKRWMTPLGPIRIMGEPVEGYVMARRPTAVPFVLTVREILGSARRPHPFGPFEPIERKGAAMTRSAARTLTEAEKHRFLLDARERRIRELEVALAANRAVAAKVRRRDETIATLRGRITRLELRLECGAALLREAAADNTNGPLARAVRTFLGAQT